MSIHNFLYNFSKDRFTNQYIEVPKIAVLSVKISQHAPSKTYRFVPLQDFTKSWTDAELYEKYELTDEEIAFIEATIKPME